MSIADDGRAQAIQVGAILLFGVLILLLASYQAFVVPNQNREVEANHHETVTTQMQELRDAIVSIPSTAVDTSVTLRLGTTYPARVVAVNPGPPAGAIRTLGTTDPAVNLTVANAVATDREVDDFWNGTNRTYDTGALVYQPGYNEFQNAPTAVYENTLLYHRFRSETLTRAGQRVVDGTRLGLVAINGSMDTAETGAVSLDLRAESASSRRIPISNATDENVTVSFASQYGADRWTDELRTDGEFVADGGHVVDVTNSTIPGSGFERIHLELEGDVTYTLGMAKVGLGTGVEGEEVAYLADLGADSRTIQEGSTATLVVEARDALNNPVTGVPVEGRVESAPQSGSLVDSTVSTDGEGRAVFEYDAESVDGPSPTFRVDFSFLGEPDGSFDPSGPANASMNVTVQNTDGSGVGGGGGSDGAYATTWQDPSGQVGVTCPGGVDDTCTLDASQNPLPTLEMVTTPTADGADVQYSVNDTSVGTVEPADGTTDENGENATEFDPALDGVVQVFTSSGGSGDVLTLEVVNVVEDLIYNNDATADEPAYEPDGEPSRVAFTVTNSHSSEITITDFTFESSSISPSGQIREDQLGDFHEFWIDTDGDGASDGDADPFLASIDEGETVALDTEATMSADSTAEVRLYHFGQSSSGNARDMVGEDATVTIHYEDAGGTEFSKTIALTDIDG